MNAAILQMVTNPLLRAFRAYIRTVIFHRGRPSANGSHGGADREEWS